MEDERTKEWAVLGPDTQEWFRCATRVQAEEALERLLPFLTGEARPGVRIIQATHWPDYLGDAADCAHARFCAWALRQLGHVTIFAFSGRESDASFMAVARNGRRSEQPTLSMALFDLLTRGVVTVPPDFALASTNNGEECR